MELKDLKNYNKIEQEQKLKEMAKECVKYSQFKTNAAVELIKSDYKASTKRMLLNLAVGSINSNKRCRGHEKFYTYLEDAINQHVQPLTPSPKDKRNTYKVRKNTKNNTFNAFKDIPKQVIAKFEYGIRIDDTIKILSSQAEAKTYLECLKFVGNKTAKIVSVEVEDLKL